jgi:hypothetical protein
MPQGSVAAGVAALVARSGLRVRKKEGIWKCGHVSRLVVDFFFPRLQAMRRYQNLPPGVRPSAMKKYYEGGFEPSMDKAEAGLFAVCSCLFKWFRSFFLLTNPC